MQNLKNYLKIKQNGNIKMENALLGLLIIIGVIVLVVGSPLLTIYCINFLFATTIPYTIYTWLATFWLQIAFGASRVTK